MNRELYEKQMEDFTLNRCERFSGCQIHHLPVLDEDTPKHTDRELQWDYLAHCNWAASVVAKLTPLQHLDIGGYGYFAGCVAPFVEEFYFADIRPLPTPLRHLTQFRCDVRNLPFAEGKFDSISCLHVLEHIGLGRYADALDPLGDLKALSEMQRVLKPGGHLLLVLPMNKTARIDFNAHRIYDQKIVREMTGELKLIEKTVFHDRKEVSDGRAEPDGDYTRCMLLRKPE